MLHLYNSHLKACSFSDIHCLIHSGNCFPMFQARTLLELCLYPHFSNPSPCTSDQPPNAADSSSVCFFQFLCLCYPSSSLPNTCGFPTRVLGTICWHAGRKLENTYTYLLFIPKTKKTLPIHILYMHWTMYLDNSKIYKLKTAEKSV